MKKKALIFTIATLLLFSSLFIMASVYIERNKAIQNTVATAGIGDKVRYLEDDIISDVYTDLLSVNLNNITRTDVVNISFSQISLAYGKDYESIVADYKNFIEGPYADKNNVDIILANFNNNFTIEPYDAVIRSGGEDFYAYTMPYPINYLENARATIRIDAENNSICEVPQDDAAPHPVITVTFIYDLEGGGIGSCTNSVQLNPQADNDITGKQFFMETINPIGTIEAKFGRLGGVNEDGVLAILSFNVTANITQLDMGYELTEGRTRIKGGNISIASPVGDLTKSSQIMLVEE